MYNGQLTAEQLTEWITEQSKVLYSDYFADNQADNSAISALIDLSVGFVGNRWREMSPMRYKSIVLYLTLMQMYELEHMEGNPSSVKAGSLDVELQNAQNPFANQLRMWLDLLGWDQWGCRFL